MPALRKGRASRIPNSVNRGLEGNHILQANAKARLVFCDWKTTTPTIAKIVPEVWADGQHMDFVPHRDDAGPEGLTGFFVRLPTIHMIGTGPVKQTFNLYDPYDEDVDPHTLPYVMFYQKLRKVTKTKQDINAGGRRWSFKDIAYMFGSETDQDAKVLSSWSKMTTYVQVLPFWLKDEDARTDGIPPGAAPGDPAHFLMLKSSAADGLEVAFETPSDTPTCDDPLLGKYAAGNVLSFDEDGQFLVVYNPEVHKIESLMRKTELTIVSDDEILDDDGGGSSEDKRSGFGKGYNVTFIPKPIVPRKSDGKAMYLNTKKLLDPVVRRNILNNYRDASSHFWIPEPEVQAVYVAQAFSDDEHKGLVRWAFESTEFWTSDVRAIVTASKSVAVTGNTQFEDPDEVVDEDLVPDDDNAAVQTLDEYNGLEDGDYDPDVVYDEYGDIVEPESVQSELETYDDDIDESGQYDYDYSDDGSELDTEDYVESEEEVLEYGEYDYEPEPEPEPAPRPVSRRRPVVQPQEVEEAEVDIDLDAETEELIQATMPKPRPKVPPKAAPSKPTQRPAAAKPQPTRPTAAKPPVQKPSTSKPAAAKPAASQPAKRPPQPKAPNRPAPPKPGAPAAKRPPGKRPPGK